MSSKDDNDPYTEGCMAHLSGQSIRNNPYTLDTDAHHEWNSGWHCEEKERQS